MEINLYTFIDFYGFIVSLSISRAPVYEFLNKIDGLGIVPIQNFHILARNLLI